MKNQTISLLPEVSEVFSVDPSIEGPILNIAGITSEIDLRTISISEVNAYGDLLSNILKPKKSSTKAVATATKE